MIEITQIEVIKKDAQFAAERENPTPQSNPYPEDSEANKLWHQFYYKHMLALSIESVS